MIRVFVNGVFPCWQRTRVCNGLGAERRATFALKPPEAKLNPPGISILIGGTPEQAAADFRRVFGPRSTLGKQATTVGTAEAHRIREMGFDVLSVPTTNFPNHGRIIHPTEGAGGTPENLERLSKVFTSKTGL